VERDKKLQQLLRRALESPDPEDRIAAAKKALALAPKVAPWTWEASREALLGVLWGKLGAAYMARAAGVRAENIEQAIAAFERAARDATAKAFPQDWIASKNNLAAAYMSRVRGEKASNAENAIAAYRAALAVATPADFPKEWAALQSNLGIAYAGRVRGEAAGNMDEAIAAHNAALSVFTRAAFPLDWAKAQNNLGIAYGLRVLGERAENVERSIAAYEAALTVHSRAETPVFWADTQNNLGTAYGQRVHGGRAENLEQAIAAFEAALTVRTREETPCEWAETQMNLGTAYRNRVEGDPAENAARAIAAFEAALAVQTRESAPLGWAQIQDNLGNALQSARACGAPPESAERAIAAHRNALSVYTKEAFPQDWAQTQNNLGNACANRVLGARAENLEAAIQAFEAALTVYTRAAFPRDCLNTSRFLGQALLETGQWAKARAVFGEARAAFLLLFGEGLDGAESRAAIEDAGSLFSDAAFAAAGMGDADAALSLASEGKARMLGAALRLQALDLPDDERARLEALRREIRADARALEAETATGPARAAALDRLAARRGALLALIDRPNARHAGRGALSLVEKLLPENGAVAIQIVTRAGAKILIASHGSGPLSHGPPARPMLTILDLPDLTAERMYEVLRDWLAAYAINYEPNPDGGRWNEWLSAVGGIGPKLWDLFAGRLDAALKERGAAAPARLVWLPAGALGILPLGLAEDPATKLRLGGAYEIVHAPSLDALAAAQEQIANAAPPTLAAVINPTCDLPATEKEGEMVASHFASGARVLVEKAQATPQAALAALAGRSYWHFASHGMFSWEDARQSGLLLHGGEKLSIGRLLDAQGLGRPRLVVLSACETGLSDVRRNPDEFIGLPATFMALGAAGVLGTLWPVSDDATALLIAKFYELHMGAGLAPPAALTRAQAWLRGATNDDLASYARTAAAQGRLDARHAAEIEAAMSADGLARGRYFNIVAWFSGKSAAPKGSAEAETRARPYAHPYFWGGFVMTGL